MNSYELSRAFCNWAFENPEKIKPIHYAIYFFTIEHCNRLGWKEKFGLPSQMVMEAIGVKNWRTYSEGLNELISFGFLTMIETSKNQYSSNIIAIVNFTKAPTEAGTKALDKALSKHGTKQSQSTVSIDKQLNKEQLNKEQLEKRKLEFASTLEPFLNTYGKELLKDFYDYWTEPNKSNTKFRAEIEKTWSLERRLATWAKNDSKFGTPKQTVPQQGQMNYKDLNV
jgi:hypothetical protein